MAGETGYESAHLRGSGRGNDSYDKACSQQLRHCSHAFGLQFCGMRRFQACTGAVLISFLLITFTPASAGDTKQPLSRTEAEILIYLMPVSKALRKQGFDVGWEVREAAESFDFWVYNSKRKCPEGCSVTVGNYSVNKYTSEVTSEDLGKSVSNQEMRGVQRIIRRAHDGAPSGSSAK